jgi:tRNA dimethylallyltransferase
MNTPLLVVVGPTGGGKSTLALELARTFSGEVVNCDSVQIYRRLNIGTAKLAKADQQGIPHHLMDILEPDQVFTAGDFLSMGRAVLKEIRERNHLPVVTGGTGLYLKALLEGLFEGPKRSDFLRKRLQELSSRKGAKHLHVLLNRVDAASAKRIAPSDQPKVIRALEVYFLTSRPLSQHFLEGRDPMQGFRILKIGLNPLRNLLYENIDRRVEQMFAGGLPAEVEGLLRQGFRQDLKPLQSLGYAQTVRHLKGELTLEAAIASTQLETRRYAKRQLTWFRKERDLIWFEGFGWQTEIQSAVKERVRIFLQHSQTLGASRLQHETPRAVDEAIS